MTRETDGIDPVAPACADQKKAVATGLPETGGGRILQRLVACWQGWWRWHRLLSRATFGVATALRPTHATDGQPIVLARKLRVSESRGRLKCWRPSKPGQARDRACAASRASPFGRVFECWAILPGSGPCIAGVSCQTVENGTRILAFIRQNYAGRAAANHACDFGRTDRRRGSPRCTYGRCAWPQVPCLNYDPHLTG